MQRFFMVLGAVCIWTALALIESALFRKPVNLDWLIGLIGGFVAGALVLP